VPSDSLASGTIDSIVLSTRPNPYDLEQVEEARRRMAELLRSMLNGDLSFIEGSRDLWRLAKYANLPEDDEDVTAFLAIDSETDALPVGRDRQHWAPEALERKAPEIAAAESWARSFGETAARRLLERLNESSHGISADPPLLEREGQRGDALSGVETPG
jgi:hypothetical protein